MFERIFIDIENFKVYLNYIQQIMPLEDVIEDCVEVFVFPMYFY